MSDTSAPPARREAKPESAATTVNPSTPTSRRRRETIAEIIRGMDIADWAKLAATKDYLAELEEEQEWLETATLHSLWNGEKIPSTQYLAEARATRRRLVQEITRIAKADENVTKLIRQAMDAETELASESPMIARSEPLPWPNTESDWMKRIEAIRRGEANPFAASA